MSEFDKMVDFLDSCWTVKDQIVPCLIGPVGIGKTAAVMQHADNVGAGKVVTIIASQILPNEVSGITMPVKETKAMEIFDHYRLSSLKDGDILFFDELLEADQLVLSACLTLIESRQLMSGHKLPDIQIIAATNPTIKAHMLKDNIRQRFVFRQFRLDREGCKKFILSKYGIDVGPVVKELCETGEDYNILTQRSLTKMAYWMSTCDTHEKAVDTANQINCIWNSNIGDQLLAGWIERFDSPRARMNKAIRDACRDNIVDPSSVDADLLRDSTEDFNSSMLEVIETLKSLPEWDKIEAQLMSIEVEDDTSNTDVQF